MAYSLSSPVTGSAQTGFTSPTYTVSADTAPNAASKQWAVTALGGTQTGVSVHSVSSPFTIMFGRPAVLKTLGTVNPTTGVITSVPRNTYKQIVRKGMLPAANQVPAIGLFRVELEIPAGCDSYSAAEVRAMVSAGIGSLSQQSAGIGDTCVSGVL